MTTSLRDELSADQGKPTQCSVCRFLGDQPPKERADWTEVLADRSFTHASIHRALMRRDAVVSRGSVENHRSNGHKI